MYTHTPSWLQYFYFQQSSHLSHKNHIFFSSTIYYFLITNKQDDTHCHHLDLCLFYLHTHLLIQKVIETGACIKTVTNFSKVVHISQFVASKVKWPRRWLRG